MSIRTLLVAAGVVALASALVSIGSALLVILVSGFSVAVLSPVATAMERRLRWSRASCSTVLVLGIVLVIGGVAAGAGAGDQRRGERLQQRPATDRGQGEAQRPGRLHQRRERLPRHVEGARDRHHQRRGHGVGRRRRCRGLGFRGVTLFFSVIFLTLFGLIDEPRVRDWIGGLLYRDKRERYLEVTDRIVHTTSRYMLGNLAISVICGTRLRRHRGHPRPSVPARSRADRGDPRPHPHHRGHDRRHHHRDRRAVGQPGGPDRLRDRDGALPADRELRPAADDHREGGPGLGLHRARQRPGVRSALRVDRGGHRPCRSQPRSGSSRTSSPPPEERASPPRTPPSSSGSPDLARITQYG